VLRAHGAQRREQLGREQQHEQRRPQRELAGVEAQSHIDRDDRDGQRREQVQHEPGQQGHPQRLHRLHAVGVGGPAYGSDLPVRLAVDLEGRQPLHEIQEVPGETGERRVLRLHPAAGARTDDHHEQGHERQRHDEHERALPVCDRDAGKHDDRDDGSGGERRNGPGQVAVESLQARTGRGHQTPCGLPSRPRRAEAGKGSQHGAAQVRSGPAGGPRGHPLLRGGDAGPPAHDRPEQHQPLHQGGAVLALQDHCDDGVREQRGLRDGEQGAEHLQAAQGAQQAPYDGQGPQQPRVQRTAHVRTGGSSEWPPSTPRADSAALLTTWARPPYPSPTTLSPVTRARKTQYVQAV